MYDRRLDAVLAAAELGSFSRAAEQLHISTPALVKQVSGFEAEINATLFERSYAGVSLTTAGSLIVDSAKDIIKLSNEAVTRAQGVDETIRLGISLMNPGRMTLELWPRIQEIDPDLRLEIVTIDTLYDERGKVINNLGVEVDIVQSSYSTVRWGGACGLVHLFNAPFCLDVPNTHPLAKLSSIPLDELSDIRIRILSYANDAMDYMRDTLLSKSGVEVIDVDSFDFALFNDAEQKGDAVLTSGAWSGIHPGFSAVRIDCDQSVPYQSVPCFLVYPSHPLPHVERFVCALKQVLRERDENV